MAAGPIRREVKLLRARGSGGSFDRGAARIGYRTRRQTIDDIGVVGRWLGNVASGEWPTKRSFAEYEAVDDGGVRLQLHLLLSSIDEHCRDARALLRFFVSFPSDVGSKAMSWSGD
jgi:hypothetical protein